MKIIMEYSGKMQDAERDELGDLHFTLDGKQFVVCKDGDSCLGYEELVGKEIRLRSVYEVEPGECLGLPVVLD